MTTTNTTYQGWTNRATWSVNLWIDNDDYNQDYLHEEAMEAYLNAEATEYSTRHCVAAVDLAEQIKDQYEESMPELDGIYGQLLQGALFEVNWIEIAERLIDDIKDEVDNKERDDQDPTEPSECDLVTTDHVHFYEHGIANEYGDTSALPTMSKGAVFTVDEDAEESMTSQLKHFMDKNRFWPNVWFLSDHGNYHLMCL